MCRYGYTAEDISRMDDIDSKLAAIEQERAAILRAVCHEEEEEEEGVDGLLPPPSPEKGGTLPAIGKGKPTPPPPPKQHVVPDYLQEQVCFQCCPVFMQYLHMCNIYICAIIIRVRCVVQRVTNVRKRYAAQIDSMLNLMTAQVGRPKIARPSSYLVLHHILLRF
jgi:hypothetical protein